MAGKGDETPPDPRLLVVESEWEAVLARIRREGNTLSATLRDAWDGQPLSTMNAAGASRQVDHHSLAVVGHITPQALRSGMTGEDLTNGFLNRFLILSVHRPHLVPWPEDTGQAARAHLNTVVSRASATITGAFTLTPDAKRTYVSWYTRHSHDVERLPERVAMAVARSSANLLRTALIYAILDGTDRRVEVDHITAAIALIGNVAASASHLLDVGKAGIDGRILAALRERGTLTRNQIRDLFHQHIEAHVMAEALDALVASGEVERRRTDTGGRPA